MRPFDEKQLYRFSKQLNQLRLQAAETTEFQAGRYHYFVDGSPLGHDCTYAKACYAQALTDQQISGLVQYLEETKQSIDRLLATFSCAEPLEGIASTGVRNNAT